MAADADIEIRDADNNIAGDAFNSKVSFRAACRKNAAAPRDDQPVDCHSYHVEQCPVEYQVQRLRLAAWPELVGNQVPLENRQKIIALREGRLQELAAAKAREEAVRLAERAETGESSLGRWKLFNSVQFTSIRP